MFFFKQSDDRLSDRQFHCIYVMSEICVYVFVSDDVDCW